jgi:predicted nucleic acid-binding protein
MDAVADDIVIVETTVWVDFFRGVQNPQTAWLLQAFGRRTLGTLDLIVCEVLQGIPGEANYEKIKEKMLELLVYNSGGEQMALASAQNYRKLRARGITIRKTIDCIIATYCIRQGFALLHKDRDFDPFEAHLGLRVVRTGYPPVQ